MMLLSVQFVFFVLRIWASSSGIVRTEYYQLSMCGPNMVLKHENRYREVPAVSALHCSMLCASEAACKSFDYDAGLRRCHLGSVDVGLNCQQHMVAQPTGGVRHYAERQPCLNGAKREADNTCTCPPAFNGPHCGLRMQDCTDWFDFMTYSDVQWIWPETSSTPFQVFCERMNTRARMLLMKRSHGDVSFQRNWQNYSEGFGSLTQDHWLGLHYMHLLTLNKRYKLKFSIKLDNVSSINYYDVHIGNESSGYKLSASPMKAINNTFEDCLYPDLIDLSFSTYDVDKDLDDEINCSMLFGGGWWFNGTANCSLCNPTGRLVRPFGVNHTGARDEVIWADSAGDVALMGITMFLLPL